METTTEEEGLDFPTYGCGREGEGKRTSVVTKSHFMSKSSFTPDRSNYRSINLRSSSSLPGQSTKKINRPLVNLESNRPLLAAEARREKKVPAKSGNESEKGGRGF